MDEKFSEIIVVEYKTDNLPGLENLFDSYQILHNISSLQSICRFSFMEKFF